MFLSPEPLIPPHMQLSVASREAEESKAAEKELRELRREARDALSEMADQNKQLVEAYMKKKAELRKVCCCMGYELGAVWNCCVLFFLFLSNCTIRNAWFLLAAWNPPLPYLHFRQPPSSPDTSSAQFWRIRWRNGVMVPVALLNGRSNWRNGSKPPSRRIRLKRLSRGLLLTMPHQTPPGSCECENSSTVCC